ncbi:MAG TPA: sugar transferase, partial [Micromonosporaceae bacterium]|nr:sugar transferase [Micromonosporaceae bacterium]
MQYAESPEEIPAANGVLRSAWGRSPRVSTWHRPYIAMLVLLDFTAAALASLTAISLYARAVSGFQVGQRGSALFYVMAYVFLPVCWLVVLWGTGAYDRRYLGMGTDEFKRVFRAALTVVALVSFVAFSTKTDLSRMSVATALVGALLYILLGRYLARQALYTIRRQGQAAHRMLLVGTLPEALEVYTAVTRNPAVGMVPVAVHLTDGYAARRQTSPIPVYAGRDVLSVMREVGADTIAVCGSVSAQPGELRRLAWQLEGTGVDLVVAPQLTDIAGPRVHIRPVEGLPLLHVEEPKLSGPAWLFKTVMDRLAAGLGLLLLS